MKRSVQPVPYFCEDQIRASGPPCLPEIGHGKSEYHKARNGQHHDKRECFSLPRRKSCGFRLKYSHLPEGFRHFCRLDDHLRQAGGLQGTARNIRQATFEQVRLRPRGNNEACLVCQHDAEVAGNNLG